MHNRVITMTKLILIESKVNTLSRILSCYYYVSYYKNSIISLGN